MKRIAFAMLVGQLIVATLLGSQAVYARDGSGSARSLGRDDLTLATQTTNQPLVHDGQESDESALDQMRAEDHTKLMATMMVGRDKLRLQFCEARRTRMLDHFNDISDRAGGLRKRLNDRLDRLDQYVTDNNLTVQNYAALKADVLAKKQAAGAAFVAMKAVLPSFNCNVANRQNLAANIKAKVEAFKAAAVSYRDSLKALFQAVKTAAAQQAGSSSTNSGASGGGE